MKADRVLLQEKGAFERVEAPCPYFGTCGGCTLQDLAYADQLTLKKQRLLKALGALDPTLTIDVVGLEDPWRYRNKAELTFGEVHPAISEQSAGAHGSQTGGAGGRLTLGYHAARSFWRIVDIEDCLLLPEPMSQILHTAKTAMHATGLPAYNPRSHRGFFRYLLIRASHATGNLLVCLMTTQGPRELIERFADALMRQHPAITSLYWGVNMKVADVAIPDELFLIRGQPYLEDRLGPFALKLHPLNFLQPTPRQAERMYARLTELVSSVPSGIAWDLYCGIGLVGFYLASKYRTVYGIDLDAHNLQMAHLNAQHNHIANIQFHQGRVEDLLSNKRFWLMEARPELIVVDPPRSGLHNRVIASLLAARPKQIVYLSCNTQTLIRDIQELVKGFPRYRLCQTVAFDLFPHTNHLEILTLLERA